MDDHLCAEIAEDWYCPQKLRVLSEIIVRTAVVGAAMVAVGWVFLELWVITVPLLVALLATSVLQPCSGWLIKRRWPPSFATWAVFLAAFSVVGGIGLIVTPMVIGELGAVDASIDEGLADIETWLEESPLGLADADLRGVADSLREQASAGGGTDRAIAAATLTAEIIAAIALVPVLTFFLVRDGARIAESAISAAPARYESQVRVSIAAAWTTLSAYVRGTAVVGAVNGTIIGIGLTIIGVPLAVPLAFLTACSAYFPLIGAVVAGVVAALVALVAVGPGAAIAVIVLVIVVQQVEGDLLSPIVLGRFLALHPLVVITALTIGTLLGGLLGTFVAVPVTAMVIAACKARPAPAIVV